MSKKTDLYPYVFWSWTIYSLEPTVLLTVSMRLSHDEEPIVLFHGVPEEREVDGRDPIVVNDHDRQHAIPRIVAEAAFFPAQPTRTQVAAIRKLCRKRMTYSVTAKQIADHLDRPASKAA